MLKKARLLTRPTLAVISPARPESARQPLRPGTRLVPSKAAVSEEARHTFRYVEPLSDTRTPLADFFSILLETKTVDGIVESSNYPAALVIARARSGVNVLSDMLVAIFLDIGWDHSRD
jgi:hypothetical protein